MDYKTIKPFDSRTDEKKDWQQQLREASLSMSKGIRKPGQTEKPGYTLTTASSEAQQPAADPPASGSNPTGDSVERAQQMLEENIAQSSGSGVPSWQDQLDEILAQILNRKDFSYDLNGDALYQQYKDQYMLMGQQAMMDTMGQAAAMTGGYGNSYAQAAGQQAYNSHLQQLNNRIPELYSLALSKYQSDGNDLMDRYAIAKAERDYAEEHGGGSGGGGGGGEDPTETDPFAGKDLRSLLVAAGNKQSALALAEQMAQWGYAEEAYALFEELYDKPSSGGGGSGNTDRRPSKNFDRVTLTG